MEKKGSSETCKGFRATETHKRSIYGLYTTAISCRPAVYRNAVFFQGASVVADRLHVVSRKRLPDYVCPATDERTSGLYIVPPISLDLKLPRLFFFSFSSSSSSSFFFLASSSSSSSRLTGLPLSRLYIDYDATSSPMYPFIRSSIRLAYRFQWREYRKDSHLYSDSLDFIYDHVANTNVLLFFS